MNPCARILCLLALLGAACSEGPAGGCYRTTITEAGSTKTLDFEIAGSAPYNVVIKEGAQVTWSGMATVDGSRLQFGCDYCGCLRFSLELDANGVPTGKGEYSHVERPEFQVGCYPLNAQPLTVSRCR